MLHPYPEYFGTGRTELTEVPGTVMYVLHNAQKFRVLWHWRTELIEVQGRYKNAAPVPRVLWHGRTDLTEVPVTGMNVVQNSQQVFCAGMAVVQNS